MNEMQFQIIYLEFLELLVYRGMMDGMDDHK